MKGKSNFRLLIVFTVLVLGMAMLYGCGNAPQATPSSSSPAGNANADGGNAPEPVTIKYWAYQDEVGNKLLQEIAEEYSSQFPHVKIEFTFLPFEGGPEKVQVAVAGNNSPDILEDINARLLTFASQGKLVPLDDIVTEADLEDISPAVWGQTKFKGTTYVYPNDTNIVAYMVNRTLFEEAGALDYLPQNEDRTWTFDEFKEALKAVTGNGVYGTAFYAGSEQADAFTFALMWGMGAETFNEDYSRVVLNSPEGVKALEYMLELEEEGLAMPGTASRNGSAVLEMFHQKKIAVTIGGVANVDAVKQGLKDGSIEAPFDVQLVMVPGDFPRSISYVSGLVAFDNGDESKIAEVKKLITYLQTPEVMERLSVLRWIPRKSMAEKVAQGDPNIEYTLTQLSKYAGRYGGHVVGFPEIRAAFFPELQAVFAKSKTPQQALDDFAEASNNIIAKYQE